MRLFLSAQGDQKTIHRRLEESLTIYRDLGDKEGVAFYCWVAGWSALEQGDTNRASDLMEKCLDLCREIESRRLICGALAFLARIKAHQGDIAEANAFLEESLAEASKLDDWSQAFCLESWAIVASAQGEHTSIACLLGMAESLRDKCGMPVTPREQTDYESAKMIASNQLGKHTFDIVWAEGHNMSLEQVLAARGSIIAISPVLATPTSSPSEKSIHTNPDGLTARELEVLRLVAQGLSNAEIAEQLVISLLTVKAHMRSMYNNLGISSRSAATRYAIEHHLV